MNFLSGAENRKYPICRGIDACLDDGCQVSQIMLNYAAFVKRRNVDIHKVSVWVFIPNSKNAPLWNSLQSQYEKVCIDWERIMFQATRSIL